MPQRLREREMKRGNEYVKTLDCGSSSAGLALGVAKQLAKGEEYVDA